MQQKVILYFIIPRLDLAISNDLFTLSKHQSLWRKCCAGKEYRDG